jgi:hypothetical protein
MKINAEKSIEVLILAIPETAGSALYRMVDMLSATGNLWQTLVRSNDEMKRFKVKIVSTLQNGQERPPYQCSRLSSGRQYARTSALAPR